MWHSHKYVRVGSYILLPSFTRVSRHRGHRVSCVRSESAGRLNPDVGSLLQAASCSSTSSLTLDCFTVRILISPHRRYSEHIIRCSSETHWFSLARYSLRLSPPCSQPRQGIRMVHTSSSRRWLRNTTPPLSNAGALQVHSLRRLARALLEQPLC